MGLIKITPADAALSKCVRERSGWLCDRCGAQHEENSSGLHAAHWHSRGNWFTRFDPANLLALCYGCHSFTARERDEHRKTMLRYISEMELDRLAFDRNRPAYGIKKRVSEIAKHYREQHKKMQALRAQGHTGRLEIDPWTP